MMTRTLKVLKPNEIRRAETEALFKALGPIGMAIFSALDNEDFSDYEDCLQEECALAISADYIVTRNTKDFASSRVPAILPDEFLKKYE